MWSRLILLRSKEITIDLILLTWVIITQENPYYSWINILFPMFFTIDGDAPNKYKTGFVFPNNHNKISSKGAMVFLPFHMVRATSFNSNQTMLIENFSHASILHLGGGVHKRHQSSERHLPLMKSTTSATARPSAAVTAAKFCLYSTIVGLSPSTILVTALMNTAGTFKTSAT